MPVVNYTNSDDPGLTESVVSLGSPENGLEALYQSIFQAVLAQPDLNPTESCMVLKQDEHIQEFALVFQEILIGRSIIEVMSIPEITGGPIC